MATAKNNSKAAPAKERILRAAAELFYTQGYNATGVQQIINEAGVSKGTFYTHFKSKDDLGLLYLKVRSEEEMEELRSMLAEFEDPYERYCAFTPLMRDWMKSTAYRGCAFANMAAEIPDGSSPIRKEAKHHYEEFREIIREMVEELINSDKKYGKLDAQFISDQFMMIQIGALTNAEIYQDIWPYEHVEKAVRVLIGEDGQEY